MGSPINRLAAILGLVMLGVIAYLVVSGDLTVTEAAVRAGVTFGAVMAVRMIGRFGLGVMADSMDRMGATEMQRRADDQTP